MEKIVIHLTRSVSVSSFDVHATVAVGRDRPEFLAVARLAADLGRPIGAGDILKELLGPRPEILGWRVIERCVELGLLERLDQKQPEAALSIAGVVALSKGEILVPEENVWRFFMLNDPLVPSVLLHAHKLSVETASKVRADTKKMRDRGERASPPASLPDLLRRCIGKLPVKSLVDDHLFQLIEVGDRGSVGPNTTLRLNFIWNEEPTIRLTGLLPFSDENIKIHEIDAEIDLPDIVRNRDKNSLWQALIRDSTGLTIEELNFWYEKTGKPVVPLAFGDLSTDARLTFRQDIEVPEVNYKGFGAFEKTVLKANDIVARSEQDAQSWLDWIQWEEINNFVTPSLLERTGRKQLKKFSHHSPKLKNASDLLNRARNEYAAGQDKKDPRLWFITAPADLGLWK